MALSKKQKELDEIKWLKSQELGQDACGSFDYCAECNKELENPCAKAFDKLHKKEAPAPKKPAAAKKAASKEEVKPVAEKKTVSSAAAKPAAKKTKKK